MALVIRWVVHSACHVLGYPEEAGFEAKKSLKLSPNNDYVTAKKVACSSSSSGFEMPVHYPRYKKQDYEKMEEWKIDVLLKQYGLCFNGTLEQKRAYAMGAFLWPDQL